jgi:hypothetical protein
LEKLGLNFHFRYRDIAEFGCLTAVVARTPPTLEDLKEDYSFSFTHPALLPIDPMELEWTGTTEDTQSLIWGDIGSDRYIPLDNVGKQRHSTIQSRHDSYLPDPHGRPTKGVTYV